MTTDALQWIDQTSTPIIKETMPTNAGWLKRLLPLQRFTAGDVIRNQRTGENMQVLRHDQRGCLVKRTIGTTKRAPLEAGDTLTRIARLPDS